MNLMIQSDRPNTHFNFTSHYFYQVFYLFFSSTDNAFVWLHFTCTHMWTYDNQQFSNYCFRFVTFVVKSTFSRPLVAQRTWSDIIRMYVYECGSTQMSVCESLPLIRRGHFQRYPRARTCVPRKNDTTKLQKLFTTCDADVWQVCTKTAALHNVAVRAVCQYAGFLLIVIENNTNELAMSTKITKKKKPTFYASFDHYLLSYFTK